MSCLKCHVSNNAECIACDGCEREIHVACAGLNAQELKVMTLRGGKRTLKFYCHECSEGIKIIPKLLKKFDEMEERINALSRQQTISENVPFNDKMAEELLERQKRSNNIVIFNLPVNEDDKRETEKLLSDIANRNINILKSARVGKSNKNGYKALKVTLSNHDDVDVVLKAKRTLKGKNIYINADLTHLQRSNLNELKMELETRKKNGEEDLIIKYVKGIPKLVKKNSLN